MALLLILITPLVAAIISFAAKKRFRLLEAVAVLASVIEGIAIVRVVKEVIANGSVSYSDHFSVDALGALLLVITSIVGFFAVLYSVGYLRREVQKEIIADGRFRQYYFLLHIFQAAMFLAILTTQPILMWIAIEATTLSTAFLISFYYKPSATEAAWKYLIINSVGLLLALFGTLIFQGAASHVVEEGLTTWHDFLGIASSLDPTVIKVAFVFLLIGYGTKVGLVPMHTWKPDAYSKAPTPIVALFSGVLLNVAFLPILRYKHVVDTALGAQFTQQLFILFGMVSVVVASFIIFEQRNYKRILAYSSIEHAGLMALGFGFGGIGIVAALLHMVYHSIAKSLMFFSVGNVFLKYSSTKTEHIRGVMTTLPVTAVLLLLGFLAVTGVPPFGLFFTEVAIIAAGMTAHPFLAAIIVLSLIIAFIGFFRLITGMIFGDVPDGIKTGELDRWTTVPLVLMGALFVGLSVFMPNFLRTLVDQAAQLLQTL